jgi:hypothetical protein
MLFLQFHPPIVKIWNVFSILFLQFQPPIPVFGIEGRYATAFYSAAMKEKKIDAVEAELVSLKVCRYLLY